MNLTQERKLSIRHKVEPLLAALDPQLKLVEILVESTRQYLGFVVQHFDRPMVLRVEWITYSSINPEELKEHLAEQIRQKLKKKKSKPFF